jgi:colanic acid/amylovoran biosynthesis glycosyltransferase
MEDQGQDIALFPLINHKDLIFHHESMKWIEKAYQAPLFSCQILMDFLTTLARKPGALLYIFFRIVSDNIHDSNFLIKSLAFFPKSVHIARIMQDEKISHVHAHYATYPALAAWIIHRLTGIPYSVTVHAHDIFESKSMLATKLKDAKFIVAISAFNRKYLIDYLGEWISNKIHVVHCGIRPEDYTPLSAPTEIEGCLKIIHVGSLQLYKGQKYLIEACRILKQKEIPFHVDLIGMGVEKKKLAELIERYDLQDRISLMGARTQEEVAAILPSGNCYIQPSIILRKGTMEGIPVALMEAMVNGLPVIATNISGIPELVEDKHSGYLVPPQNPEKLAEALINIYDNYAEANRLAGNGREKVLNEFNLHKNVKELSILFEAP